MKLIALALSFCLLVSIHAETPAHPPGHAKITKNEAEHIALKQFPGASVASAELKKVHDRLVWELQITPSGKAASTVKVDAMTGRIISSDKKKS